MRAQVLLLLLAAASLIISANGARADVITYTVGPGEEYSTISTATGAETSGNSYIIIVTPGTYTNDFPVINQPTTIETATPGSQVVLVADGTVALAGPDKGIILNNSSLTVNGLTFEGAEIDNSLGGNGAGIRDQSTGATSLIVENSTFMNNQEGILTGNNNQENVKILNSQFINNGNSILAQEHALYVNDDLSLLVSNSVFCGTLMGSDVKSRAESTTVTNSQMYVGTANGAPAGCDAGTTSFGIDLPYGGQLDISNDNIFQGDANSNGAMVSYGEEGLLYGANSFMVSDTLFDNLGVNYSTGIQELVGSTRTCLAPVQLSNTTFTNVNTPITPSTCVAPVSTVFEPGSFMLVSSALTGLFLFCWRPWRPTALRSAFGAHAFRHSALIFWR